MENSSDNPDQNQTQVERQVVGGPEGQNTTILPPKSPPPRLRNWLLSLVVLVLLGVGAWAVMRLSDDPVINQPAVVKNEVPLIRMSVQEGPINLFYYGISNDSATLVNNQMYEGLVTYENVNKIVPLLATSWTNPDDKTWLFTLKDGVKFHNGKTLTAKEVKVSLDNASKINSGGLGIELASVEVVNPQTVKVVTKNPDPLLLGRLSSIWIAETSDFKEGEIPAGTGPYTVKAGTKPTADLVELSVFGEYHGGQVYTKELSVKVLSIVKAVEEFNKGNLDMVASMVSGSDKLSLPDQKLVTSNDFTVTFLAMNTSDSDSPLSKLKVRQAIELAIDPTKVLEANKVLGQKVNQFVTADIPGFNTELTFVEKNVELAKTLLKEAGYEDGFSVKLSYASSNNDGMFDSIKEQLAEIGVTVERDGYGDDNAGFFAAIFGGTTELLFLAYSPTVLDSSDTFSELFCDCGSNYLHYNNKEISDLLTNANKTLDEAARLTILKEVGSKLKADVPAVPLYTRDNITALAKPYVAVRHLPTGAPGFKFHEVYLP